MLRGTQRSVAEATMVHTTPKRPAARGFPRLYRARFLKAGLRR